MEHDGTFLSHSCPERQRFVRGHAACGEEDEEGGESLCVCILAKSGTVGRCTLEGEEKRVSQQQRATSLQWRQSSEAR